MKEEVKERKAALVIGVLLVVLGGLNVGIPALMVLITIYPSQTLSSLLLIGVGLLLILHKPSNSKVK